MNEPPVFDVRARRRGDGITSASSHPELLTGEFAIPPRRHISAPTVLRSVAYDRRRAWGGTLAITGIALLLWGVAFKSGATADGDPQKFTRNCMQWHLAASAVVSRKVQSMRDADLVYVTDAIHRMRRARRNCELGEFAQACDDYQAVASSLPGYAMSNELFSCSRIAATASTPLHASSSPSR